MLNFKPITLDDKEIFDKYLKPYKFNSCEYSFTSLFIWRKACKIEYTIFEDVILVKKVEFDGKSHLMTPIGYTKENLKHIVDTIIDCKEALSLDYIFRDAEKSFVDDLLDVYGDKFIIEEDRDNFDYVYESEKLISLSGKKLHKKKNNYNHFIKNYNFTISPITEKLIDPCIKAAREWCKQNNCKGYLLYELKSIEELLKNNSKLDFIGIVVYINDKISAFTIGEKMTDDMALIHIEKADNDIRGLYNFINKSFVEEYFKDVKFINREEDLGLEGLRKAKLSYMPSHFVEKFNIKLS